MKLIKIILIFCLNLIICSDDFYELLNIPRDAELQQIKKAFRTLSQKYHPDKNPGNKEAADMFLRINRANEVLSDPEMRKLYDMYGEEGLENPNNLVNHHHRQKSPNARVDLHVDLEDLYNGAVKEISISKNVVCKKCHGTGGKLGKTTQCKKCGGRGVTMQDVQQGMFTFRMQNTCPQCSGKGIVFAEKCDNCKGRKVIKEDKTLRVEIEKGMKNSENIVFKGESEQQPDTLPGDLIVHLKQNNHRFFNNRIDNDLHGTINLTLKEALLGYKRKVVHLDKREIEIKSDLPTSPFHVRKIDNEGMPFHNYPSQKGQLYLKFNVRLPTYLTEEEKDLITKLFE